MKKIGMIGGLSWVSTAEYYKRTNEIMQQEAGGVSSARIVLESVNRQDYVGAVIDRGDESAASEQILASAHALEAASADFIVITCNDVHRFVPTIQPLISIPFLHIADVTAAAIAARARGAWLSLECAKRWRMTSIRRSWHGMGWKPLFQMRLKRPSSTTASMTSWSRTGSGTRRGRSISGLSRL